MRKKIALATLICFLFVTVFQPALSLAWMSDNGMSSPIDITSNVHKAYFESGDGTKEIVRDQSGDIISGPFEIATPLQLYYFAWLQYLGFFNVDNDNDGVIDTVYFRLSKDLDMNYTEDGEVIEYVLPPIGTRDTPFLGSFDGEGHIISDLTIENNYDNLFEVPNGTDQFGGAEIIGFFGVVGALAEGDYKYDTSANQVKNFVLEDVTIKTQTSNALVGIVAGYVNAPVEFVGVVNSRVTLANKPTSLEYTSNLSDYSLIGYCTEDCKDSVYVFAASIKAPGTSDPYNVVPEIGGGTTSGWGGSVKMSDIVTWLTTIMNRANSTNNNYILERTDYVALDGTRVTKTDENVYDTIDTYTVSGFGSFIGSTMTWNNNPINFLGGAQKVTSYSYVYGEKDVDVYFIKDGDYYLTFNGTTFGSTTEQEDATWWYASEGANGGAVSTVINGRVYFLNVTADGLSYITDFDALDMDDLPEWDFSEDRCSLNGISIECDEGTWQVVVTETGSYKIAVAYNNTTYYLDTNGTNAIRAETNINNAAIWTITEVAGGYTLSTVINNVTYYLNYPSGTINSNNRTLSISTNPSTWQMDANNHIFVYTGNNNNTVCYLRYSSGGGNWVCQDYDTYIDLMFTSVAGPNDSVSVETDMISAEMQKREVINGKQTISIDNSLRNGYYNTNGDRVDSDTVAGITYFPLSTTVKMGNTANQDSYSIDSTNTGYIIGAEWGVNDGTLSEHDGDGANIRISRYGANSMGENAQTPYTMTYKTNGKFQRISDRNSTTLSNLGLSKFADCYQDYISSIQGGCSGLHFMQASVSTSNMTRITAHLKGETYENYQVPTNCIDFNLYERGFINFVAGSYYTQGGGNDSFFSIYEIVRDPNDKTSIKEIKEICKIYAQVNNGTIDTSKPYYYTYFDSSRNETGKEGIPSGYQMVFDSQWITHPDTSSYFGASNGPSGWDTDQAYYFEVPVNAGEYAIGSTKGRTGAYLVYLDLAANAQLIDRTQQVEEITETLADATIPNGVGMLAPSESGYDTSTIDPSTSAFVSIGTNASGTIEFDKNGNVITQSGTTGTTAEYISVDTVLNDGEGNPMSVPITQTTKIVRTTYRDYNLTTGDYIVTVITTTTVTVNGQSTTTYTRQITTTPPEGEPVVGEVETFDKLPTPETKDKDNTHNPTAGNKLIDIAFAYGQEVDLTISYTYIPAGEDENGTATPPTYLITITNPGEADVAVKALLTADGVSSGITFIITDGTTETTLNATADVQKVVIAGTASTEVTPEQPEQPEEQPTE